MPKLNFKLIAKRWQRIWKERKLFEADPVEEKPKFFITVPYPYVNGFLHIGHTYTDVRPEVFARYKRMQGYNVLFPFAFHATGTPIEAAARFVVEKDEKQLGILTSMGFKEDEIPAFKDPKHWVKAFSKAIKKDLFDFGLSIDWRRSFITTQLNPRYSKFIQWQFRKLEKAGYLTQGSHPVVWCPKDQMAVGDHARHEGEGEVPEELTIVKFKAGDIFFPCTTSRPETVFGVTNIWINPEITYVQALVDGETWIVAQAAVCKLEAQKHSVKVVDTVQGTQLLNKHAHNPVTESVVPVFPASFVTETTGTGVVMSVPAHAPMDFAALEDCKKTTPAAQHIQPKPVISVEGYGTIPAADLVKKYGIASQNDPKLAEATTELYAKEYHTGKMRADIGSYAGMPVQNAKANIIERLVREKKAVVLYELLKPVVCRCRTVCLVKIVDNQWFLAYGNSEWKNKTHKALSMCKLYPEKIRGQFEHVIDWLKDWACARQLGLGTPLPQDKEWVIESLSDSTIYNAYYTIAHVIENIPVSQVNDALFDFVFLNQGVSDALKADHHLALQMQQEFSYWYPVDFRTSGKDLIQNHLTFYLFNHTAVFSEKHWPAGIGVNGYVTLNKQKMSKSKGNVRFLRDLVKAWGADIVRITILSNAEEVDDVDWDDEFAESIKQKLEQWFFFAMNQYGSGDDQKKSIDDWFVSQINKCVKDVTSAMDQTKFRTALQVGFFDLQRAFKWYQRRRAGTYHAETLKTFIEVQTKILAPFTPHVCEEIWMKLQKQSLVSLESWPVCQESAIKPELDVVEKNLGTVADDVRTVLELARVQEPKQVTIIVAADWKSELFSLLKEQLKNTRNQGEIMKSLLSRAELKTRAGEVAGLVQKVLKDPSKIPESVLHQEAAYQFLKDSTLFFKELFHGEIEVVKEEESREEKAKQALPGKPSIVVK